MLCCITASTNANREAPFCERGDRCDRLCRERWVSLRYVKHKRANGERLIPRECGGRERERLKNRSLCSATPHQVIPNPDALDW